MASSPKSTDYDKNTDFISPVTHPQVADMWSSHVSACRDGRLPETDCPHPQMNIQQYVDCAPGQRDGDFVNLYECMLCHRLLRMVDGHGKAALDR